MYNNLPSGFAWHLGLKAQPKDRQYQHAGAILSPSKCRTSKSPQDSPLKSSQEWTFCDMWRHAARVSPSETSPIFPYLPMKYGAKVPRKTRCKWRWDGGSWHSENAHSPQPTRSGSLLPAPGDVTNVASDPLSTFNLFGGYQYPTVPWSWPN